MDATQAARNLEVIRTLMERSAIYRRALAPIMLFAGIVGGIVCAAGIVFHLVSTQTFCGLWLGTAALVVAGAFFIARKQAKRDGEDFWSPPTRRVAQALLPPFLAGTIVGLVRAFFAGEDPTELILLWCLFYGCALHSAGSFMTPTTSSTMSISA